MCLPQNWWHIMYLIKNGAQLFGNSKSKFKCPCYRKGLDVGVVLLPLIGGVPGFISMPLPKAFSSISDIWEREQGTLNISAIPKANTLCLVFYTWTLNLAKGLNPIISFQIPWNQQGHIFGWKLCDYCKSNSLTKFLTSLLLGKKTEEAKHIKRR